MCIKIYDLATWTIDPIVWNLFFTELDNHKKKHKRNKVRINFFFLKKSPTIVNVQEKK